jgi:2Fe-2S ferredoxin
VRLAAVSEIPYIGARAAGPETVSDLGRHPSLLPSSAGIMPKINYVAADGSRYEVDAENGSTVMENAIRNGVPGIEAECGGACACATCHVYVDEAFKEIVGEPEPMEEDMLDFAFDVRPTSRLSCQIRVRDELDGLTVTVPERQG